MTVTIIQRTQHGWTDNLGQIDQSDNQWPDETAANQAIAELQAVGFAGTFRVVPTSDLEDYDLVF